MEVTGIQSQKRQRGRLNIFLDGRYALSLGVDVVADVGLKEGDRLSDSQVEELVRADQEQRCYAVALGFLGYRARSRREVRDRLVRHGFGEEIIGRILDKLEGQGLLNDEAFARYWLENRESFNPRGQKMLKRELIQKGIAAETVTEVVSAVDEGASALRAAQKRIRNWPTMDYREFERRLGGYLGRRGFGYEVIKSTVRQLWMDSSTLRRPVGEEPCP